ncbi:MAG: class I SAM-dependent methyltransferase [Planctomycetes bacterium]|nr:class I SAM-dependent methyltransferase [Planctomycetota bacterium]MCP4770697.1 class I SAM-dependent methyltransferase [Planctomycetota bacterium]MCP4860580.1 class I SAM-dependent methyltransferase [Planctomycetota bacterium]
MSSPTLLNSKPEPIAGHPVTAKSRPFNSSAWRVRAARRLVLRSIGRITCGELQLVEPAQRKNVSEPTAWLFGQPTEDQLHAKITVQDPRFWVCLVTGGALGAAEAYAEGWWHTDDLTSAIRLFARNRKVLQRIDGGLAKMSAPLLRRLHRANRNTMQGSRKNIEAHYDLSNEFFSLFLDPTMTYSCGLFADQATTLEQAQIAKIDHLCRKLELTPETHLLEVGTGWGGFARHAARECGCRVTTTTISKEQHAWAKELIAADGLEDQVELLLQDYRSLQGKYDRVVSVEMVEAVGADFLGEYFETLGGLLKPGGVAAVQAITIQDQDFERASRHIDFIKRYIFPGSCIPSVTAMCEAMTKDSDLKLVHLEDFTPHYATTLDRWSVALQERHEEARAMGLDEHFLRTWEYYFRYCEGGFAERHIGLVQMMLAKPASSYSLSVQEVIS